MDWKTTERLAASVGWYPNQAEVARFLGKERHIVAAFLQSKSVPWRKIGKGKQYFLPEVLAAVDKTKWAMNDKIIARLAESVGWFPNLPKVARFLGKERHIVADFLSSNGVPWNEIGKEKQYFLPKVLEAIDKTKWA